MKKFMLVIIIGIIIGIVDVVPMIIMGLNWYANASAFVHWIVVAIIIFSLEWNLKPLIKGLVAALMMALPTMFMVAKDDPASLIPIVASSIIFGSLLGYLSGRLKLN